MATYFQGNSEIQADGLQTLYLMNPSYIGYPDTPQPPIPTNMVFLSSTGNTLNPASLSQSGQTHNQQLVGIPLQPTHPSSQQYPIRPTSNQQEIPVLHGFSPVQYKLWSSMDQQIPSPSVTGNSSVGATDYTSQLGLRRSSVVQQAQQGLSLSLSPQQTVHRQTESGNPIPVSESITALASGNEMRVSGGSSSSAVSIGTSNIQSALLGSKYLKVTQQLLDEVVNVGNGIKTELSKGIDNNNKGQILMNKDQSNSLTGEGSSIGGGGDASVGKETELSTGERQELQMKKAKLVTMLDEVGERYKQYYQQMQIVVSSFEQAAGFGSAKTYTALALQTISKQFRCLKDAILAQIRATGKNLGEEDFLIGGKVEGSRLRFFDHQIRQQRALQQLGMIQQNAWRPQRGLPERSVSILRAWLFEHFLHPYPKDSDKLMLAKQTGLTRSQVSNWFINARVRLWKPMVEEMYMEETKDQEHKEFEDKSDKNKPNETSGSKSTEHSPNSADQTRNLISKQDKPTGSDVGPSVSNSTILTSIIEENIRTQASGFFLGGTSNGEEILQGNAKKQRNELQNFGNQSMDMEIKSGETNRELCMNFGSERQDRNGYSMITNAGNHGGGFGTYNHQIGEEIGRFDHDQYPPRFSNGFSLTLGLPHCENLSLSGNQQTYLSNQNIQFGKRLEMGIGNEPDEFGGVNPPLSHSKTPYENINMENRKRFSAQLLPDFVT